MGQILIFDTTLRDGTKAPGTILTPEEKIRIAKQLGRLRVDVLEAGFPAASEEQYSVVERIAGEIEGPILAALARATNPKDFEIAWKALRGATRPRIHTFVPVSREYREHFLKKNAEQVLEIGASAIRMAKQYTPDVEFSLVDAFRAKPDDVVALVKAAVEAGATTINLADTVGCAIPTDIVGIFGRLRSEVKGFDRITWSIHCHNDLGLAVANSITAIAQGAGQIHCTINGIGERAGNAPLEELAAILSTRSGALEASVGIQLDQIYPACRLVSRLTGISLEPHKPIVGSHAFSYEIDVPQLADATDKPPFEIMAPERFGAERVGEYLTAEMDLEGFAKRVAELGYELEGETLKECYQDFLDLTERKEKVFDADLELLVSAKGAMERLRYRLLYLNVTAGSISVPNATVQLEVDGQVRQDAGFGHGPVDAAYKTVCKILKRCPRLVRYEVNAVTPGVDAQGEVTMGLEEDGHMVTGRGIDTDIVMASAKAMIDGLNKLDSVHEPPAGFEFSDEESWMPRL